MSAVSETGTLPKRDYSLTGPEAQRAIEKGLAAAEWYHTEVPRKTMKELMQRSDAPAIRVLVRAGKGERGPLTLLPGLGLNDANGRPSAAAEEILREGAVLPLARL